MVQIKVHVRKLSMNRKGIAYTAVFLLLLSALLSFSVVIHLLGIWNEKSVTTGISSSTASLQTRSFESALFKIVKTTLNTSFDVNYSSVVDEGTTKFIYTILIDTSLNSSAKPNEYTASSLDDLISIITTTYDGFTFTNDTPISQYKISLDSFIELSKNDSSLTENESVTFYYNKSGLNPYPIRNFSITIYTNISINSVDYIARNISLPSALTTYAAGENNVTIILNDLTYPSYAPDDIENISYGYIPTTYQSGMPYLVNITERGNTIPRLQLVIDEEKIVIKTDGIDSDYLQNIALDIVLDVSNQPYRKQEWVLDNHHFTLFMQNEKNWVSRIPVLLS